MSLIPQLAQDEEFSSANVEKNIAPLLQFWMLSQ